MKNPSKDTEFKDWASFCIDVKDEREVLFPDYVKGGTMSHHSMYLILNDYAWSKLLPHMSAVQSRRQYVYHLRNKLDLFGLFGNIM